MIGIIALALFVVVGHGDRGDEPAERKAVLARGVEDVWSAAKSVAERALASPLIGPHVRVIAGRPRECETETAWIIVTGSPRSPTAAVTISVEGAGSCPRSAIADRMMRALRRKLGVDN